MRIKVVDKVFGFPGLAAIVARKTKKPPSSNVTVRQIVDVLHSEQNDTGLRALFKSCDAQFWKTDREKRLGQLAEGAFYAYTLLKAHGAHADDCDEMRKKLKKIAEKADSYSLLFRQIVGEELETKSVVEEKELQFCPIESAEADSWFALQAHTLLEIDELSQDSKKIKALHEKTKEFTELYKETNALSKKAGKKQHPHKTLHGAPFDHNRMPVQSRKEITYADGKKLIKEEYHPGFEGFYIAGSSIQMPYGKYDLMQAPLAAHDDKVDTVKDFWDSVVVLRKSPIIVTVHDPKEKIPRRGLAQRAEYWTHDRFETPMILRNGWQLERVGDDELIAKSSYYDDMQLVKRTFIATHKASGEQHTVTQFHYQGWPDHCGAPDHELLEKVHDAVDLEMQKRGISDDAPITAHCAAGLGRSPVFAISHLLRRELQKRIASGEKLEEITLNLAKTVYGFNKQRPSQLGDPDQWQSVLLSLRRLFLKQKGASLDEIRSIEAAVERKTLEKAARDLEDDLRKRQKEEKPDSLYSESD